MTHIGSPVEWYALIESQVPRIIELVIGVWESLPSPTANELENDVTNRICARLQNHPERGTFQFHIVPQNVILEPDSGAELGRTDIAFKPFVPSDSIYFCLECKRLNVRELAGGTTRGYHVEYVRFGIVRFVSGQYAESVHAGGMLGFVLDGDVDGAVAGVGDNVRRLHAELGMPAPGAFLTSSIRPADARLRETIHVRTGQSEPFRIHHMFLAGDPNAPFRPDLPPSETTAKTKAKNRRKSGKQAGK